VRTRNRMRTRPLVVKRVCGRQVPIRPLALVRSRILLTPQPVSAVTKEAGDSGGRSLPMLPRAAFRMPVELFAQTRRRRYRPRASRCRAPLSRRARPVRDRPR